MIRAIVIAFILLIGANANAQVDDAASFQNPQRESLYRELIGELRCLVCANQSLADSNSELAKDLRARTAEMIRAGQTRAQVVDYMVARYGEYVLYRPRFSAANLFLWVAPFVAALIGLAFILLLAGKKSRRTPPPYSAVELKDARKLLDGDDS